jgi:hypothetical protein
MRSGNWSRESAEVESRASRRRSGSGDRLRTGPVAHVIAAAEGGNQLR